MKIKNYVWGAFCIAAAALFLGNQLGYLEQVSWFSLLVAALLIPKLVESLLRRHFFGVFIPLALLAFIFREPMGWDLPFFTLMLAAVLTSVGFRLIFGNAKIKDKHVKTVNIDYRVTADSMDADFPRCDVSFSASVKYIQSENLTAATLHCCFGSLEVYFDQAVINPAGASAVIDCLCSSVELYIPRDWVVLAQVNGFMSSIEDNRFRNPAEGPIFTIMGHACMSSVEIHRV